MNHYNRLLSICWRANTDITPLTTVKAVMEYILKYCSKAETQTLSYTDMMKAVLPKVDSVEKPFLSFVARFLNSIVGERDWSAQEVAHLLMHLPLQRGTRTVVTLDCRLRKEQTTAVEFDNDEDQSKGKSALEKYEARPDTLRDETLFRFIT